MQNKAKVKIGKMNISIETVKNYDKNTEQSTMNVTQNKAKQSQSQKQKSEDRRQNTEGRKQTTEDRRRVLLENTAGSDYI